MTDSSGTTTSQSPEDSYKYWAFISYCHQDEKWSAWLHRALETYRVPRKLVSRITAYGRVPARVFPVFRDRDELAGSSDLGARIQDALRQSRYLVVICSPQAAMSDWVNEEARTFKSLGRDDQVLCLIVDGEPNASEKLGSGLLECFPPALRFRVGEDGQLTSTRVEPIAADARKGKDGWTGAKLKLLAGILDVSYDELRQRELQRKRWLKIRLTAAGAILSLLVAVGYIAIADKGLGVPAGGSIRTLLDRFEITLFRPVHTDVDILRTASLDRRRLVEMLRQEWNRGEWFAKFAGEKGRTKQGLKVWAVSQALTGIFRTPSTNIEDEELRGFLNAFEPAFEPGTVVEVRGSKYGWRPDVSTNATNYVIQPYTRAEPALWTAAALAVALARPGLLNSEQRRHLENRLTYTHEVAKMYRPLETGGWNVFPHQTKPDEHSAYVTALALLALLETRSAGLPWEKSIERRDVLLTATANWLIARFNAKASLPGWSVSPTDPSRPILDGLTLQIYSELLRAEEEAGIGIPSPILKGISQHLESLVNRPLDYREEMTKITREFTNYDGQSRAENERTNVLWHPWAIECAVRWRHRMEKRHALKEEKVGAQRVLGHLVVDLRKEAMPKALSKMFIASESLYALALIPAP